MAPDTDTRILQLPVPLWAAVLSAVAADREPARAIELLRQAGFDAGRDLLAHLQTHAGAEQPLAELPADRFWEVLGSSLADLGWGRLEYRQPHPGVAELVADDWAEAAAARHGLGCQFTTGVLSELLTRIAGDDVAVLEVECAGRGDPRCRFLVGGPEVLAAVYGDLAAGRPTDEAVSRLG